MQGDPEQYSAYATGTPLNKSDELENSSIVAIHCILPAKLLAHLAASQ
jgi:hypothetical protein